MHPYRELIHGGDTAGWCSETGRGDPLDFSANISPLGLPEGVRAALAGSLDAVTAYPDPLCRALRDALSDYDGVPADWILPGAGAADLIFRLAAALRPQRALLLAPTFAEYELALARQGCRIDHYALDPARDFAVGEDLLDRVPDRGLVLLCNPNNPSGALCDPALLRRLLAACRARDALLAVDECFLELVDDPDTHTLTGELAGGGLLLLRAFTKSYALPGLRLGYLLCADPALLGAIDRAGPPWSVSVPAQLAGVAATRETAYLDRLRALVRQQRTHMTRALQALGLHVFPGSANFLLLHAGIPDLPARLRRRGVLVRDCANFRTLTPGYLRIAIRSVPENQALLSVLHEELLEEPAAHLDSGLRPEPRQRP